MTGIMHVMTSALANESRHYETIILGAGISGLACASRLYQHHHFREKHRLLVLEARDRIGGRIASVNINGNRLDTGANWMHGVGTPEKPNPLIDILPQKRCRELSGTVMFGVHDRGRKSHSGEMVRDDNEDWIEVEGPSTQARPRKADTDEVVPSDIAGPLFAALWETIGELNELAPGVPADEAKHTAVLKALTRTETLRKAFSDTPKEYHSTLSAIPQFLETMEAAPLTAQSAETPEDMPGMSLIEYAIDDFEGDQVFLQDGYTAIIEELAKELKKADLINTSTEVKTIDWNNKPILIHTNKGTYTAMNVVCTLPLGVLKHSQKQSSTTEGSSLFQPAIPRAKQEAITKLGFGTLDKIFPVFSHPWWDEEPFVSIIRKGLVERPISGGVAAEEKPHGSMQAPDSFLGFTTELPGIAVHPDGSTSTGPQRLSVINLHSLTGFPALSVFVACANAIEIEGYTDEQASDLVHRAFTKWFGHEPPKPDAIHVTRWAQDEYSRGSYSHMITGVSETRHREEFQKPAVSEDGAVLRFAGEHTSRNHFATAHGALISGWREADAILQTVPS